MDFLTDELERMANNIAQYTGPEFGSEIPLERISEFPTTQHEHSARSISLSKHRKPAKSNVSFLVKMGGVLATAAQIQAAAGLAIAPAIIDGTNDDGQSESFCRITQEAMDKVELWLSENGVPKCDRPAVVRLSQATKELSSTSPYPTLGLDTTLPQHRLDTTTDTFRPLQDESPVWYFFYGTLADPDKLTSLLGLPEDEAPILQRASIQGGLMRTWAGKYKALVDGSERVSGWIYSVKSKEHEDVLLAYETEKYEVVRCRIEVEGQRDHVFGCTFRFVDDSCLD